MFAVRNSVGARGQGANYILVQATASLVRLAQQNILDDSQVRPMHLLADNSGANQRKLLYVHKQ